MSAFKPEFAIFDVFNILHTADENDNSEMREVLRRLSRIQAELKCGICVLHHYSKAEGGSMTQRLRGASAIAGWAEWVVGLSMSNEQTQIRKVEFELKAAAPPEPVHFRVVSGPDVTRLECEGDLASALLRSYPVTTSLPN